VLGALGLRQLLAHPVVARVLHLTCAAYLVYLGIRMWYWAARLPHEPRIDTAGVGATYRRGLMTILTNPKAAAFFGTIFTAAIPRNTSWAVRAACVVAIAAASVGWHCSLALTVSGRRAKEFFARAKPTVDRVLGSVMIIFGIRLLAS